MSDTTSARTWLTIPDLSDRLGITPGKVRKLIEDRSLVAVRRDGVLSVPDVFLAGDQPLSELKGTIILLGDIGFSDDEIMQWLLEPESSLDAAPIDALLAGRKAEVRRIAQALL
ncbi:Rv2175c family DNA-binding protein [Subtercola sp. YIM 133946]|uniref:Rv2175c family DNA-binding protein n=1 Tax=Subtercola sp. YIM 133946 TaxID=3118909 RepID=UPI002F947EC7